MTRKFVYATIALTLLAISQCLPAIVPNFNSDIIAMAADEDVKREEAFIYPKEEPLASPDLSNPYAGMDSYCGAPTCQIEGLFYFNPDSNGFRWWLATGMEYNSDYTVLKFFIRKGVTWSDGHPFTAQDVIYTLKMIKSDEVQDQTLVRDLTKFYAPDDYTVVLEFKEPRPRMWLNFGSIYYGSGLIIVPEHIWSKNVDVGEGGSGKMKPNEYKFEEDVWTGPFVKSSATSELIIFKRNENYWAKDLGYFPKMKWVIMKYIGTLEGRMMALQNNEIEMVYAPTHSMIKAAAAKNSYIEANEHIDPLPVVIYVNIHQYPFNYSSVRWALAHSINQTKLIEVEYEGHGQPWHSPMAAHESQKIWIPWELIKSKYDVTAYNPSELATALTSVGCTKGSDGIWRKPDGSKISFEVFGYLWYRFLTESVGEQLKAQGFDVVTKIPSMAETDGRMARMDYTMVVSWTRGRLTTSEPFTWFENALYGGTENTRPIGDPCPLDINYLRWKNATFDKIVDQTRSLSNDDPKFAENIRKLYEIYLQELPLIVGMQPYDKCGVNNYYWTGWPQPGKLAADTQRPDYYTFPGEATWGDQSHFMFFYLQPTGRTELKPVDTTTPLLINVAVGIVGIVVGIGLGVVVARRKKKTPQ